MISSRHRFHGYRGLGVVYRFGATSRGPLFGVKVRRNERRKSWRAAVVVGRKINKSAVARNRIRRRLYEALRLLDGDINGPYDIVVSIYHDSVRDADFSEIKGQLKKQLGELGVTRSPK